MTAVVTAASAGLLSCRACHLVSRPVADLRHARCPRCGAPVSPRKPDSIARTWCFLIAATVLYIPANVLPVMDTSSLFQAQQDTIWSGVRFLWSDGSYITASIVFFASIVEPVLKLVALALLALTVQRGWSLFPQRNAATIYRIVHVVGRWSMLDIFVVTILVALVQSPTLAEIKVGPGAIAFAAVVVLTMFAAMSFDPRLLWDARRPDER